jgi:hypothetical protein
MFFVLHLLLSEIIKLVICSASEARAAVFEEALIVEGFVFATSSFCNFVLKVTGDLLSLDEPVYTVVNKPSKSGKMNGKGYIYKCMLPTLRLAPLAAGLLCLNVFTFSQRYCMYLWCIGLDAGLRVVLVSRLLLWCTVSK